MTSMPRTISARRLLDLLLGKFGPQEWWPADDLYEMMCGAILVQNTRWENVEMSLNRLMRDESVTAPEALLELPTEQLQTLIRPSGFMTAKAAALQALARWVIAHDALSPTSPLRHYPDDELRGSLLAVRGVGPETADVISLFAFDRVVFIWSTYATRLLTALGHGNVRGKGYEACRRDPRLDVDLSGFSAPEAQELHALTVRSGKSPEWLDGLSSSLPRLTP